MRTQPANLQMTSARPRRRQSGFTLVEITVAIMVLGFGIASSVVALRVGFGMIETARDQTIVAQILQSEVETLRLMAWRELADLPSTEEFTIESEFTDEIGNRFTCIRRIEDVRPGAQVKRVVLEVRWTTNNGVARELTYKTRISRDGLNDYYYRSL